MPARPRVRGPDRAPADRVRPRSGPNGRSLCGGRPDRGSAVILGLDRRQRLRAAHGHGTGGDREADLARAGSGADDHGERDTRRDPEDQAERQEGELRRAHIPPRPRAGRSPMIPRAQRSCHGGSPQPARRGPANGARPPLHERRLHCGPCLGRFRGVRRVVTRPSSVRLVIDPHPDPRERHVRPRGDRSAPGIPRPAGRRLLAPVQHRVPGSLSGRHELPGLPEPRRRGPVRGGLHPVPRAEPGRRDVLLRLLRARASAPAAAATSIARWPSAP